MHYLNFIIRMLEKVVNVLIPKFQCLWQLLCHSIRRGENIFMKCVDVFLQRLCIRKWFTTWFTFVIFVSIMNMMEMYLQVLYCSEWFATWFTFVIFVAFMNYVDVPLQIMSMGKWFATRFTFMTFLPFVNCIDVPLQSAW